MGQMMFESNEGKMTKTIYEQSHNFEYLFFVIAEHIKLTRDMIIVDAQLDEDHYEYRNNYYHILVVRGDTPIYKTYSLPRAIEWALQQPIIKDENK
jgi:hypothetical protein